MIKYLFLFLGFLAIMCGLMVVFSKKPIRSVLFLVLAFFALAGEYVLLNAQFLAMVHIIVYAGAIMVLFLFVIMLLDLHKAVESKRKNWVNLSAVLSGGILFVVLIAAFKNTAQLIQPANPYDASIGLIEPLGKVLFNDFLLPFEVASILFLTAMVGAVMIGKKAK